MAELKQKVEELTMQGEYQLRLKDMTYSEKLKEVSDHFNAELEEAKREYDMLMQSRDTLEVVTLSSHSCHLLSLARHKALRTSTPSSRRPRCSIPGPHHMHHRRMRIARLHMLALDVPLHRSSTRTS